MLEDVVELLTCPVCGASFGLSGSVLRCANGHGFDVARQGYVNLMPGGARPGTADTAEMVADRAAFLGAGHYQPLASAVSDLAATAVAPAPGEEPAVPGEEPVVLDAGAGTGYYLAAVLSRLGSGAVGLALDVSARALRRAARAAPGIGAVAWDTWQPLPVRSGTAALVLNIFAPRNGPEFRRVLRPDGTLLVVTPAPGHLAELAIAAGLISVDEHKDERLAATLGPYFTATGRRDLSFPLRLTRPDAARLVAMGPSARHTTPADTRARLAPQPEPIPVTASFTLTTYRPR
ncbi:MAG TPA: 23S rRNA methyltransferase [Streptosporangiaceae bacterium]|nr:23S rRNA methyltransferase [Streptosporangiaceae bacterium]